MLKRIFVVGGSGAIGVATLALVQIKVGALFGTGPVLDAFFVGAALPSLLLSVSAGAIFSIVIPRLPDGPAGARTAGRFAVLAGIWGAAAAALVALAAPLIVEVVAPGLDGPTADEAARVLRVYAITIAPTSVAFVFSAYAYSIERPYVSGASTSLYGLAWFGLLFLPAFSGSAVDVAVAGVIATCVQVGSAFLLASPRGAAPWPVTRQLTISRAAVAVAATVLGATVVNRLALLLDPLFGSLLDPGSISQLTYASRFMLLAVFLSGQGAAFSLLVVGRRRDERSDSEARIGVVVALLLSLGGAVIFAICGAGLAQLLLARGELTSADAEVIGELLRIYAPAIVAITLIWALEAVLYAGKRVREILRCVLIGLLANVAASAAFIALLGIDGRPLGVLVGGAIQLALLLSLLRDDGRVAALRSADTRARALRLAIVAALVTAAVYAPVAALASSSLAAALAAVAGALVTLAHVLPLGRAAADQSRSA